MKATATNVRLLIDIEWRHGDDLYKADQAIAVQASEVMPPGQYKKLLVHLAKFVKALPEPKPIPGRFPQDGSKVAVGGPPPAQPKTRAPARIVGPGGEPLIS